MTVSSSVSWLCDMDGVLINDGAMVPGADKFLGRLRATDRKFLVLTNNAFFTPEHLRDNLASLGLDVDVSELWTSALATAQFLHEQRPGGSAFVIGEPSVHQALENVGYSEDPHHPDYVVLGDTWSYSYEDVARAIRLIERGVSLSEPIPRPTARRPTGYCPGPVRWQH